MALSVNGAYALIDSSLIIGGVPVKGLTKFDFNAKREKVNNYAAGEGVYSRSRKHKTFDGTAGMYYREVMNITRSAGVPDLTDVPPFDAVFLVRSSDGDLVKHTFKDVEFTEHNISMEKDGDDTEVDCPFIYSSLIIG